MTSPGPAGALATRAALVRALRGAAIADDLADDLLVRASAAVRNECGGWSITRETDLQLVLDGPGTSTLMLPTLKLREVKALAENGIVVDVSTLDVSAGGMVEKRSGGCWTRRLGGITVTIDHGYDEVPADVAGVVVSVAAKAFANPTSQQAAAAGIVTDTFGRGHGPMTLSDAEKALLTPWRLS